MPEISKPSPSDSQKPASGCLLTPEAFQDFREIAPHLLKIQSATGGIIPFVLNDVQKEMIDLLSKLAETGEPIRIIALKPRKVGLTTLFEGLFFFLDIFHPETTSLTVAHTKDTADLICAMRRRFCQYLRPQVWGLPSNIVPSRPAYERVQYGNGSCDFLMTAGGHEIASGGTFQLALFDEVSKWERAEGHAQSTATSAFTAVQDTPDTLVAMVSTAKGARGLFYDQWRVAELGQSQYRSFFFPWYRDRKNSRRAPPDFTPFHDHPEFGQEVELQRRYGLTADQLFWRRHIIQSPQCNGDMSLFQQEFPANPTEAFRHSGDNFFSMKALEQYREKIARLKPIAVGRLAMPTSTRCPSWTLEQDSSGPLHIWEHPQPDVPYVIGADVSEGLPDGDYDAIQVLNGWTLNQAAEWHGRIDQDQLGLILWILGHRYNMAWIAVEANAGFGILPLTTLRDLEYPHIYRHRQLNHARLKTKRTSRLGWYTTSTTREPILAAFNKLVREQTIGVNSPRLLAEMETFVREDRYGHPGADAGEHDDLVMAMAIAIRMQELYAPSPPRQRETKESQSLRVIRLKEKLREMRSYRERHMPPRWICN